jgi:hypothetical protein
LCSVDGGVDVGVGVGGYSKAVYQREMNELHESHMKRLLNSKAYEMSATHDQLYLRQGLVPTPTSLLLPFPSSLSTSHSELLHNDPTLRLQEERIHQLRNQYLPTSGSGTGSGSAPLASSATESRTAAAGQLSDILDDHTNRTMEQMRQRYQNKYNRQDGGGGGGGGGGGMREEKLPVNQFLDKWLNDEVTSGALLNPTTLHKAHPTLANSASSTSQTDGLLSDSLDSALHPSGPSYPSALSVAAPGPVGIGAGVGLRSQSSYKTIKPDFPPHQQQQRREEYRPNSENSRHLLQQQQQDQQPGFGQPQSLSQYPRRRESSEDPELVYREKFQPSERLPRQRRSYQQQHQQQQYRDGDRSRQGVGQYFNRADPTDPYSGGGRDGRYEMAGQPLQSYPPQHYQHGYHPYGGAPPPQYPPYPHNPPSYPYLPHQPPPLSYQQSHPYQQQPPQPLPAGNPFQQPQPPYSHHHPSPPVASSPGPATATAAAAHQLNSVASLLEQENARLVQLGGDHHPSSSSSSQHHPKSPLDDLLSELGLGPGVGGGTGVGVNDSPPKRLSRAEMKHREEMKQIQFEMEKLRMTEALEEMKSELGRKKALKSSEEQHEAWLEDQKRQLQALKIKQALALEESKLQEATVKLPSEMTPPRIVDPLPSTLTAPPLPTLTGEGGSGGGGTKTSYVDNMSLSLDGLFLPSDFMKGQLFRLSLSFFTSKGKPLGRPVTSGWSRWNTLANSRSNTPLGVSSSSSSTLQIINPPLTRLPPKSLKYNALSCATKLPHELGNDPMNFILVLCELQYKETEETLLKPLGWCVYHIPVVSTVSAVLPGKIKEDELRMFPGLWRVKVRKGLSNPQGRQKSTLEDGTDGWFLCRLSVEEAGAGGVAGRGGPGTEGGFFENQVSSSESLSNLSRKYLSLEGGTLSNETESELQTKQSLSELTRLPSSLSRSSLQRQPTQSHQPSVTETTQAVKGEEIQKSSQLLRQPSAIGGSGVGSEEPLPPRTTESRKNLLSANGNPSSRPTSGIATGLRQLSRSKLQSSSSRKLVTPSNGVPPTRSGIPPPSRGEKGAGVGAGSVLNDILSHDEEEEDTARGGGDFEDDPTISSTNPLDKFWILGTPTGPCSSSDHYQRGDGVDIYIDSALFLPDNCTVTRCVAKLLTNDFELLDDQVYEFFSLPNEGTALSPLFKYKIELRQSVLNMTLTLLLRLDTCCSVSLSSVGVGYTSLKLFCNQQREQCVVPNDQNVYLNTGAFQLPLYGGRLKKGAGGRCHEGLLNELKMPSIPCASVLVRISPAPKSSDGLLVLSRADYPQEDWERMKVMKVPVGGWGGYLQGGYDGRLCEPSSGGGGEGEGGRGNKLLSIYEAKSLLVMARCSVEVTCRQAIMAYQSTAPPPGRPLPPHILLAPENLPRGGGDGGGGDSMSQWIESLLLPSNQIDSTLDYTYTVPYDFSTGLSVCVDELHAMPEQGGIFGTNDILHKVIYSMNPPGLFYKDPPLSEGLHFTRGGSDHLTSPLYHPVFSDGFAVFHPTVIERKLCFIFDVRLIQLAFSKQKVTD